MEKLSEFPTSLSHHRALEGLHRKCVHRKVVEEITERLGISEVMPLFLAEVEKGNEEITSQELE